MPKVVETKVQTSTKTSTEADGTIVEVITTTTTEKYSDGSSGIRTETKTIRKSPVPSASKSHHHNSGQGHGHGPQILDVNLTPENSTAPKVQNTTDPSFIQECLEEHNRLRAKHGASPLTLDDELGKIAQSWCNEIAKKGAMQHNTTGFGENIYWNTDMPAPTRPAQAWHSEIKDYNFNKLEGQKGTGHFTQLIWKATKKVGIAMQQGKNGYYIVANYYPPGNIVGRFPENIQK